MKNQDQQRIAAAFERLFRTYGPLGQGSTPEEVAADRMERVRVYLEAVEQYDPQDVEQAVTNFLSGNAPGAHNPSFAPPAPLVGSEVRRVMNLRLDHERRQRPALPPPMDRDIPDDERARVADGFKMLAAELSPEGTPEHEVAALARKAAWNKVNARFSPSLDETDMKQRLGFGDPEGDRDIGWDAA